jgi:hypothetical protein
MAFASLKHCRRNSETSKRIWPFRYFVNEKDVRTLSISELVKRNLKPPCGVSGPRFAGRVALRYVDWAARCSKTLIEPSEPLWSNTHGHSPARRQQRSLGRRGFLSRKLGVAFFLNLMAYRRVSRYPEFSLFGRSTSRRGVLGQGPGAVNLRAWKDPRIAWRGS